MLRLRLSKRTRGSALTEYVWLIAVAASALALVGMTLIKGVRKHTEATTAGLIGPAEGGQYTPYNATGGKQLAEQSGLYDVNGYTATQRQTLVQQQVFGNESRAVIVGESMYTRSPGWPGNQEFKLEPVPEYTYKDDEKVPVYVPPFVRAEEGYIQPPTRD